MKLNINEFAAKVYEQNVAVGWWDDPNRCPYETLQLVSTEVAEATEGERKNLNDDKLPHRKMGEVELADALIRIVDFGAHHGLAYLPLSGGITAKTLTELSVGHRHFIINCFLVDFSRSWEIRAPSTELSYSSLINLIYAVSESLGYDLEGAAVEKLEFNRTRADHKRENRAKEIGKKF